MVSAGNNQVILGTFPLLALRKFGYGFEKVSYTMLVTQFCQFVAFM